MSSHNPKYAVGFLLYVLIFIYLDLIFSVKCTDCEGRKVNKEFFMIKEKAQTGDIILTDSQDFFSKMIKDVEVCPFAGAKIVYKYPKTHLGNAGEVLLLVSDANNLSDDKHGLRFGHLDEYFEDYKQVKIGLFRPHKKTKETIKIITDLKNKALDKSSYIPYDFSFDNDDEKTLTCSKLLMSTYGDLLLDRKKEKARTIITTTLPCDIKLENMDQIGDWIEYWEDDIAKK